MNKGLSRLEEICLLISTEEFTTSPLDKQKDMYQEALDLCVNSGFHKTWRRFKDCLEQLQAERLNDKEYTWTSMRIEDFKEEYPKVYTDWREGYISTGQFTAEEFDKIRDVDVRFDTDGEIYKIRSISKEEMEKKHAI